jgi:LuxR family maltose regulon positive regulatory protein
MISRYASMIILESKVQIPVRPQNFILRTRLRETLESKITQSRLALVCAPAGYGKTILLADWARASSLPVAWLSMTGEEQDVESFLRYLFAAWEKVQPKITETPLGILLESNSLNTKAVLSEFLNAAGQAPDHLAFVLDDFHLIDDKDIYEAVAFLLDHLPSNLHFVLAGRSEPPLPLARYRAHDQLVEIRIDDLRCTREESATFLNRSMGLTLASDRVDSLHKDTEGWIAGLQLAALTLQSHPEEDNDDIQLVSGRDRFIADYLAEDVLERLPADTQDFLMKTSLLDRLYGPLCEAVTGVKEGQDILERLERENLFLVPLDVRREWFRYHQLFADFLYQELNRRHPQLVPDLHRRAARWYLAHDLPDEALRHAIACQDARLVIQIGEQYFEAKLLSGEARVLTRWLDSFPERWQFEYPLIGLFRVAALLFTGALEDSTRYIDGVEQRLVLEENEETRWSLARVSAVRCSIACFQNDLARAESYANRALQDLPEEDHAFRAAIHHALGDTYRRNGLWQEARTCYLRVLDQVHTPTFRIRSVHVFGALADLELQQGRLRESATLWKKALAVIEARESRGTFPLPLIGWVYLRMGEILYEWNELEKAAEYLSEGLERSKLGGDVRAMIAGHLLDGYLKLASSHIAEAAECLEQARVWAENAPFPDWIGRFGRFQLEVWLAQDRLRSAVDWADAMLQDDRFEGQLESETAQLAMVRALIVRGDPASLGRAKTSLRDLIEAAEGEGRTGVQIEALALQALADWKRGEQPDAMIHLENALRLAEPEGYVRLFVDLGPLMARLLQEAHARGMMPEYIKVLLAAFGGGISTSRESPLPEPLTPREQETLNLIAAGLTNQEIAEQLVVSLETVKKHAARIYNKLGVRSRTQAAARARELGLLD